MRAPGEELRFWSGLGANGKLMDWGNGWADFAVFMDSKSLDTHSSLVLVGSNSVNTHTGC